jgi:P4 family phage/plasmid primase-like protien
MASAQRGQSGTWEYLAYWRENGSIDLDATLGALPASDRDAAELFASCWPDQVFYDPGKAGARSPRWHLWDGRCHPPDASKAIDRQIDAWTHMLDMMFERCRQQLAAETALQMTGQPQAAIEAAITQAWDAWKASAQWKYAHKLRSTTGANALRERLAGVAGTDTSAWPHHPLLLNAANCVVSLHPAATGWEWRPHDPSLKMTYCLPTPWAPADNSDPLKGCPRFASLVWHACGKDTEVFWYLVSVLGYSLLGDNRHQVIFFLSGPPASGKTTMLEVVSGVLGELAHEAKPQLVTISAQQRHGRHEASIRGKRLVTICETNEQLRLDENQLKILTGQSRMSVDVVYKEELTGAVISALVMIANNNMPEVAHMDDGLTRRIWVVQMGETIPPELQVAGLAQQIVEAEAPGVLSLLVWACRQVMESGGTLVKVPPAAVVRTTAEYRQQQNTAMLWRADRCQRVNGSSPAVRGAECLTDYREWCADNNRIALGQHHFYAELAKLDGVSRTGPPDQAWFTGIALMPGRWNGG